MNDGLPDIRIRRARPTDAEAGGALIHEADAPNSTPIFGLGDPQRAIALNQRLFRWRGNSLSYDITSVAETDGDVVGLVSRYPSRREGTRFVMTLLASIFALGPLRFARVGWRARHFGAAIPKMPGDAYHVLALAVDPGMRGRGMGTKLLDHAHQLGREAGYAACSLQVVVENAGARRLYERLGYREIECKTSNGLRRLTGASGLIHMQRPLEDA